MMDLGHKLTVTLPGETTRGEVVEVRSADEVVVGLTLQAPMNPTKTHSYQLGDTVVCRRSRGMGGLDRWEAVRNG